MNIKRHRVPHFELEPTSPGTQMLTPIPNPMENRTEQQQCAFCGCSRPDCTITFSEFTALRQGRTPICRACNDTMQNRSPLEWLRWIKRNNPSHWERVVDHHRLGKDQLSSAIRRIRIG